MAAPSTCAKATTLSIWLPPTFRDGALRSFLQLTGDYRDADVMAGWNSRNPQTNAWIAAEASFGNGFLERLEHRQQYKLNGLRQFNFGSHQLTLFGIGYYGFSYVPGLIPIDVPVPGDTIDNRQLDITHTCSAGRHRQLEAQRAAPVLLLRLLSQLRAHPALQFRRRPDSAERNPQHLRRRGHCTSRAFVAGWRCWLVLICAATRRAIWT